jgi:hypothetical protein
MSEFGTLHGIGNLDLDLIIIYIYIHIVRLWDLE